MANLTEKAAFISFGNILRRMSLFLSGIIVVRFLSQEQLGSFRQVNLVINLASIVLLFGLPNSIYFFVPKAADDEKRGILSQTYLTLFIIGALSGLGVFLFAPLIAVRFRNPELSLLLRCYAPYLAINLPVASFFAVMMSLNKAFKASGLRIILTLTQILATLIPVLLGYSLLIILMTMLIVNCSIGVFLIGYSISLSPKGRFRAEKGFILKQIRFALPLGMGDLVGYLSTEVDKIFISTYFSVTQFAVYSVGALQVPITTYFASAISTVLLPEFVKYFDKGNTAEVVDTWRESRRKLSLITFPMIFCLWFISPEFLKTIYGNTYAAAIPIFQIYLALPLLANFESRILLQSTGKTPLIFYTSLLSFGGNVILNYLLIQRLGELGPPLATIVALLLGKALTFYYITKKLKIPWHTLFPWKEYGKITSACFVGGIPIMILRNVAFFQQEQMQFYFLCLGGCIFGCILLVSYVRFVLQAQDFILLQRHISKLPGGSQIFSIILWTAPEHIVQICRKTQA